ncbi:hypothetical protein MycrhDRAFT_0562 [Mycolicibacterium rhodesiae JS60]|nr:hypothetical protein MycrhDRAFT_0562 [Mycolicibacterium rhodesiae JS60]
MRARVGVHSGRAMACGPRAGQRVPGLLVSGAFGGQESALQSGDQILHRTALAFRGADHSPNPAGLGLLTAALISLEGTAVGCQVSVELFTLGQQHRPEMFGLKAIRGFGCLLARVHIAR